jgi:hypothetical protein
MGSPAGLSSWNPSIPEKLPAQQKFFGPPPEKTGQSFLSAFLRFVAERETPPAHGGKHANRKCCMRANHRPIGRRTDVSIEISTALFMWRSRKSMTRACPAMAGYPAKVHANSGLVNYT